MFDVRPIGKTASPDHVGVSEKLTVCSGLPNRLTLEPDGGVRPPVREMKLVEGGGGDEGDPHV